MIDYERIFVHLELVQLSLGEVLYKPGQLLDLVYFPTTSIISLLHLMKNKTSTELAIVGNDGILGIFLFMGSEIMPSRCVVQSAGFGYRLKSRFLIAEFNRHGSLKPLLLRYTQAFMSQIAQTAVCNKHHSIEQQLCRWILLSLDRLNSNQLSMTQELIANMLGVYRQDVMKVAIKLQQDGLIEYSRGRITVNDRPNLEIHCCECYKVVKQEYNRLLP